MRLRCFGLISLFLFCMAGEAQNGGPGRVTSSPGTVAVPIGGGWQEFSWGAGQPVVAGTFTFTATGPVAFKITDDFCPGDIFQISDNGVVLGVTTTVAGPPRETTYTCPDQGGDVAFANPLYSHGTFPLAAGSHSITVTVISNFFGNGAGWLRVDPYTPVPPPLTGPHTGMVIDNVTKRAIVFNADSDTVIGSVALPSGPTAGDCSITADQKFGFVTNFNSQVSVIDLTAITLAGGVNSIPISNLGEDTSISFDGNYLLVTDGGPTAPVSIISLASRTQIGTFTPPNAPQAVDTCSDGSVLTATTTPGNIYRLSLSSAGILTNTGDVLSVGGFSPLNVNCAPGAHAGVAINQDGNIQSFAIPGLAAVDNRATSGSGAQSAAFSPAGDRIYVRSNGGVDGFTFNAATGALGATPFVNFPASTIVPYFGIDQLAIHPNGMKLYVPKASGLEVHDATSGALLKTLTDRNLISPTGVCLASPHM